MVGPAQNSAVACSLDRKSNEVVGPPPRVLQIFDNQPIAYLLFLIFSAVADGFTMPFS